MATPGIAERPRRRWRHTVTDRVIDRTGPHEQERRRAALAVPRRPVNQLHGTDLFDESRENKGEHL